MDTFGTFLCVSGGDRSLGDVAITAGAMKARHANGAHQLWRGPRPRFRLDPRLGAWEGHRHGEGLVVKAMTMQ